MGAICRKTKKHEDAAHFFAKAKFLSGHEKNVVGDEALSDKMVRQMLPPSSSFRGKTTLQDVLEVPSTDSSTSSSTCSSPHSRLELSCSPRAFEEEQEVLSLDLSLQIDIDTPRCEELDEKMLWEREIAAANRAEEKLTAYLSSAAALVRVPPPGACARRRALPSSPTALFSCIHEDDNKDTVAAICDSAVSEMANAKVAGEVMEATMAAAVEEVAHAAAHETVEADVDDAVRSQEEQAAAVAAIKAQEMRDEVEDDARRRSKEHVEQMQHAAKHKVDKEATTAQLHAQQQDEEGAAARHRDEDAGDKGREQVHVARRLQLEESSIRPLLPPPTSAVAHGVADGERRTDRLQKASEAAAEVLAVAASVEVARGDGIRATEEYMQTTDEDDETQHAHTHAHTSTSKQTLNADVMRKKDDDARAQQHVDTHDRTIVGCLSVALAPSSGQVDGEGAGMSAHGTFVPCTQEAVDIDDANSQSNVHIQQHHSEARSHVRMTKSVPEAPTASRTKKPSGMYQWLHAEPNYQLYLQRTAVKRDAPCSDGRRPPELNSAWLPEDQVASVAFSQTVLERRGTNENTPEGTHDGTPDVGSPSKGARVTHVEPLSPRSRMFGWLHRSQQHIARHFDMSMCDPSSGSVAPAVAARLQGDEAHEARPHAARPLMAAWSLNSPRPDPQVRPISRSPITACDTLAPRLLSPLLLNSPRSPSHQSHGSAGNLGGLSSESRPETREVKVDCYWLPELNEDAVGSHFSEWIVQHDYADRFPTPRALSPVLVPEMGASMNLVCMSEVDGDLCDVSTSEVETERAREEEDISQHPRYLF